MITIQEGNGMKYVKEGYSFPKYPDAKKIRDRRARELRKEGYTVEVKTWDFQDLARGMYYTLEAKKFGL
jgi:flagellar biosynthesis protein FlhB